MDIFRKMLAILARLGISIALLVLLFRFNKIDLGELFTDIRGADKLLLSAGFLVFFAVYLLGFLRWQMLLKAAGIVIPLTRLVISFSGGVFFSVFLPSTIGGDLIRAADLAGHTRKAKEVIATVFLDRLSGYTGLAVVVIIAVIAGGTLVQDKVVLSSVFIIIAVLLCVMSAIFNSFIYSKVTGFLSAPGAGKIKEMLSGLHHEIYIFRKRKGVAAANLLISVLIQAIVPLSVYLIGLSLGIKAGPIYYFVFFPIISAITLLPVALGGLGLRENLFVVYFAKAGVAKQLAIAMSILSFAFIVIIGALGGLIYVLTVHHRRLQHNPQPKLSQ